VIVAIQILLILAAGLLFVVFIRRAHSVRIQAAKRIGYIVFIILNLYAVLRPADTTRVAKLLGVGRGADLLLYLLVIAFAFFSVNTYLRFKDMERRLTDLTRAIAIRDARAPIEPPLDVMPIRMPPRPAQQSVERMIAQD
jgi:small membrane protein